MVINDENELYKAITAFKQSEFTKLRLWEFYVIDKRSFLDSFSESWDPAVLGDDGFYKCIDLGNCSLKEKADLLKRDALVDRRIGHRFSKTLDLGMVCSFITKVLQDEGSEMLVSVAIRQVEIILNEINLEFYQEYDLDTAIIFDQIQNRAHYLRVAPNGPKLGVLCEKYEIIC